MLNELHLKKSDGMTRTDNRLIRNNNIYDELEMGVNGSRQQASFQTKHSSMYRGTCCGAGVSLAARNELVMNYSEGLRLL